MEQSFLAKARELRAIAWDAVTVSEEFRAFKAFDDAVVSLGGNPLYEIGAGPIRDQAKRIVDAAAKRLADGKKLSQGDAAEVVLRMTGLPMNIAELMEAAVEKGAEVRGSDPLSNFRSTISKDDRFYSVKAGSHYYWWLKDKPLPPRPDGLPPPGEPLASE